MKLSELIKEGSKQMPLCLIKTIVNKLIIYPIILFFLSSCSFDSSVNSKDGSPLDKLPGHISVLTDYGMRADFSPDKKHLIFLDKLIGNVHQYDFETKSITDLTSHYENVGYKRPHNLSK